ncbi:hypothetical protein [Fodinibius sp. Rm-B-1B1-1]|uniref:hypothetical protein n=1 Tax=Fodinibius alkaliphilus TaxID=3140241 RepID=UPI003159BE0B
MNISTHFPNKLIVLTFATALLLAGCNNPASNDDHEEHSDPHSIEFVMNGDTIVTYADGEVSGHFHLEAGQETSLITAEFFDEDGNEIHGEDLGDEYSLGWEIANTDHADIEQHDEDGKWSFHIVGKSAGETTVIFKLMHGADHSDFSTNSIEIHVEEHNN